MTRGQLESSLVQISSGKASAAKRIQALKRVEQFLNFEGVD